MKHLVDNLPSRFKGYPEGLKIYYEEFVVGDLKQFFKASSTVDIIDLYAGKIKIEGVSNFDVWDLWYGDFQYLVVQIYMLSIDETVLTLRVYCSCGEAFTTDVSLVDMRFRVLDDKEEVFVNFGNMRLRPPKLKDYRALVLENFDSEKLLDIYVDSDKELGSRLVGNVKIGKFLKTIKNLDIGALPFKVKCSKCGNDIEVPFKLDFFSLT